MAHGSASPDADGPAEMISVIKWSRTADMQLASIGTPGAIFLYGPRHGMFLSGRGRYDTQRTKTTFTDGQSPNPHVHVGSGEGRRQQRRFLPLDRFRHGSRVANPHEPGTLKHLRSLRV